MTSWQPIETAPKDGTVFLGCDLQGDYAVHVMQWYEPKDRRRPPQTPPYDGYWRAMDSSAPVGSVRPVKWWMPLPPPPLLKDAE